MRVFRALGEASAEITNSTVSIGNFDGVHEGHKALLRRNLEIAGDRGWVPSILTFDPHPTKIVAPQRAPKLLSTMEERLKLIAAEGIGQAFVLPFDYAFSELSPESFARQVLAEGMGAKAVLVGENFRFGNRQAGDVVTLRTLGEELGFETHIVSSVSIRGKVVSSSAVRDAIQSGKVGTACRLLGRPYSIQGNVVRGHGIGSRQTVPTLNLDTQAEVLPMHGVYISRTFDTDDRREWPSITNVGFRPTFGGDSLTIETFLLSELQGETPQRIQVAFLRRVREEILFKTPDELKRQIMKDVESARAYFRRVGISRANFSFQWKREDNQKCH